MCQCATGRRQKHRSVDERTTHTRAKVAYFHTLERAATLRLRPPGPPPPNPSLSPLEAITADADRLFSRDDMPCTDRPTAGVPPGPPEGADDAPWTPRIDMAVVICNPNYKSDYHRRGAPRMSASERGAPFRCVRGKDTGKKEKKAPSDPSRSPEVSLIIIHHSSSPGLRPPGASARQVFKKSHHSPSCFFYAGRR